MFHPLKTNFMNSRMAHFSYEDDFKSIFSPYILRFLEMKEASGSNIRNLLPSLREFDRFVSAANLTSVCLTQTDIMMWRASITGRKATTIYGKICIIGQFCRYLVKLGIPCHIPVYPRKPKRLYVPYIFSKEELNHIFNTADELLLVRRDFSSLIFSIPALLRLLYSTGIRIGEAILLKNRDVDIISRTIILRDTKNRRERQIPIGETLFQVLDQYIMKRDKLPIPGADDPNSPFFISLNGKALGGKTVRYWFLLILKQCHIDYIPGVGPRIHDLRHTFAVHALDKLVKEGSDIYCCLPILSVALGHKCVSDTEYYLRITNQVYPDLSEVTSAIAEYIFPTINIMP